MALWNLHHTDEKPWRYIVELQMLERRKMFGVEVFTDLSSTVGQHDSKNSTKLKPESSASERRERRREKRDNRNHDRICLK